MSNQQYTSPRLADALLGSVAPLEVGWREPTSEQAEVCGALLGHLISDLFLNALMQSPVGTYHELRSGEESALFTAGRFPETDAMSENFVYPTELLNLTDLLMNQLTLALPELE
jgi:hypothetical protein